MVCSKILTTKVQDLILFPRLNLGDSLVSLFILDYISQVLAVGCRRLHSPALEKSGSQALWSGELGDLSGGLGSCNPSSPASKSSHPTSCQIPHFWTGPLWRSGGLGILHQGV